MLLKQQAKKIMQTFQDFENNSQDVNYYNV